MFGCCPLPLEMRIAEQVAEPVGVAVVAAEQRLQRVALEARLIAVLEQLEQAIVSALLLRRRCSRWRCHDRRRGKRGRRRPEEQTAKGAVGGVIHFNLNQQSVTQMRKEALRLGRNAPSINEQYRSTR